MRKLNKALVAALVAGSALGVAIPAQAQYYPQQQQQQHDGWRGDRDDNRYDHNDRYDNGQARAIAAQIQQLEQRVNRVDSRDRISEREAATLRRAVANLRQEFRSYSRNGLTQREAQILRERIQRIRARLQYERHDNDGRRW